MYHLRKIFTLSKKVDFEIFSKKLAFDRRSSAESLLACKPFSGSTRVVKRPEAGALRAWRCSRAPHAQGFRGACRIFRPWPRVPRINPTSRSRRSLQQLMSKMVTNCLWNRFISLQIFFHHQCELLATSLQKLLIPRRQLKLHKTAKQTRNPKELRKRRKASSSLSDNCTLKIWGPTNDIHIRDCQIENVFTLVKFIPYVPFIVWLVQLINSACFINDLYHAWTSSE